MKKLWITTIVCVCLIGSLYGCKKEEVMIEEIMIEEIINYSLEKGGKYLINNDQVTFLMNKYPKIEIYAIDTHQHRLPIKEWSYAIVIGNGEILPTAFPPIRLKSFTELREEENFSSYKKFERPNLGLKMLHSNDIIMGKTSLRGVPGIGERTIVHITQDIEVSIEGLTFLNWDNEEPELPIGSHHLEIGDQDYRGKTYWPPLG
jgi:hypothetical protein